MGSGGHRRRSGTRVEGAEGVGGPTGRENWIVIPSGVGRVRAMKHAGKATQAGLRIIYWSLFLLVALLLAGVLAKMLGQAMLSIAGGLVVLWVVFMGFCVYFFRDPEAKVPAQPEAIVAPGCGKVDVIDEVDEPQYIGGRCRRISIFLSVFDIHVQRSPVAGEIELCKHAPGQFLNAMRTDSAASNENLLIGIQSKENPGERVAVRLIAGLIARRIVPWIQPGDVVARGERLSLIQFGSRVELYLPLEVEICVKLGDHVRGGETVVARRVPRTRGSAP